MAFTCNVATCYTDRSAMSSFHTISTKIQHSERVGVGGGGRGKIVGYGERQNVLNSIIMLWCSCRSSNTITILLALP